MAEETTQNLINEELSLLYSSCVSEIISFKSQQWHTTNYGLLLYAVIASIPQIIKLPGCIEWFFLTAVPLTLQ